MARKERKPTKRLEKGRPKRKDESPEPSSRFGRNLKKPDKKNGATNQSRSRSKSRSKGKSKKVKIKKRRSLQKLPQHEAKVNSLLRKSKKMDSTFDINESKLKSKQGNKRIKPIRRVKKSKDEDNESSKSESTNSRSRRKRPSKSKGTDMVAEESPEPSSRVRRSKPETTKNRKKPHSLPPLSRTPKSPIQRTRTAEEGDRLRRLIGSPPPSGFRSRRSSGGSDRDGRESWISDGDRRNSSSTERDRDDYDERLIYTPLSYLEDSNPRITINKAPRSRSNSPDEDKYYRDRDNIIVSASRSEKSFASYGSLALSNSSQSLNSSLSIPPKLISYRAENGSRAVQEWIPDDRSSAASSTRSYSSQLRRNSTPSSIRDLPSPLEGTPPLDVDYSRYPNSRSRRKLKPLNK